MDSPPPAITVRLNKHSPIGLRQIKAAWIAAQYNKGHSLKNVAAALGMSSSSAHALMRRHGHAVRSRGRRHRNWGRACCAKAFLPEQLAQLDAAADQWGCSTLSEVVLEVVRDWLVGDIPPPPTGDAP